MPYKAYNEAIRNLDPEKLRKYKPEDGGESLNDVFNRAQDFVHDTIINPYLLDENNENNKKDILNFLIISHGGFISELISSINYLKDPKNHKDPAKNMFYSIKNTGITVIKITYNNE